MGSDKCNEAGYPLAWGDEEKYCFHNQMTTICLIIFGAIIFLTVIVAFLQVFWDRPRRRKRFHDRPKSGGEFERDHAVAEGRFPPLSKVIDEQEEKDKAAGLDPKRPRNLDPAYMEGSQRPASSTKCASPAAGSAKGAPPMALTKSNMAPPDLVKSAGSSSARTATAPTLKRAKAPQMVFKAEAGRVFEARKAETERMFGDRAR